MYFLCVSNEPGVAEPNVSAGCLHMGRHIRVKIHAANAASARRSLRIRAGHNELPESGRQQTFLYRWADMKFIASRAQDFLINSILWTYRTLVVAQPHYIACYGLI